MIQKNNYIKKIERHINECKKYYYDIERALVSLFGTIRIITVNTKSLFFMQVIIVCIIVFLIKISVLIFQNEKIIIFSLLFLTSFYFRGGLINRFKNHKTSGLFCVATKSYNIYILLISEYILSLLICRLFLFVSNDIINKYFFLIYTSFIFFVYNRLLFENLIYRYLNYLFLSSILLRLFVSYVINIILLIFITFLWVNIYYYCINILAYIFLIFCIAFISILMFDFIILRKRIRRVEFFNK